MLFSLNEDEIKAALVLTGKASGASEYFEKWSLSLLKELKKEFGWS